MFEITALLLQHLKAGTRSSRRRPAPDFRHSCLSAGRFAFNVGAAGERFY